MIMVYIYLNKKNDVYSFKVNDHGNDIVCAAVSTLALNTVNSIEAFTAEKFTCNYEEEDGGFLFFESPTLKNNKKHGPVAILLNSFFLGIQGIAEEYPDDIILTVDDKEVNPC